jgi:hypothetical protein
MNGLLRSRTVVSAVLAVVLAIGSGERVLAQNRGSLNVWPTGTKVTYELVRRQIQTLDIPEADSRVNDVSTTLVVTLEAAGEREFAATVVDASTTSQSVDIRPLVGLKGRVRLDDRGRVVSAEGLEENDYVTSRGGVEMFRADLQNFFLYIPQEPFRTGLKWTLEDEVPSSQSGLQVKQHNRRTFRCVGDTTLAGSRAFKIGLVTDSHMFGEGEQAGQSLGIDLSGRVEETIIVDPANGMILSREGGGNIAGAFTVDTSDLAMSLKVSSTVKRRLNG